MIFVVVMALFAVGASLQSLATSDSQTKETKLPDVVATPLDSVIKQPADDINQQPFRDNPDIYQYDDPGSVVTLYITVRRGNKGENTNHTWKEVNDFTKWFYTNETVVNVGKAEAIVQVGDETGPLPSELGYTAVVPNATIQIRGASTSMEPQKSYKIELNQGAGKWRGQSTIALNKHIFDPSRVRNKLNFDLMKQIPNMVSLRTQFVHLYIKDQTTDPWETTFLDYGLFTQIELPSKTFLKAHLLDSNGQLYKTTFFEFERYPDEIRLVDDPLFDENAFSSKLEMKGNRDNSKLLRMLEDLNNSDLAIETVFEEYFDADNYFTWMAYNILVGNVDTSSQNFYLYSPHNSEKFYFIPWDYDDSFFRLNRVECCEYWPYYAYEYGVSNYWATRLANRLFRISSYRHMLDDKVNEVRNFLSPDRIRGMLDVYRPVAEKYALQMPDLQYFPTTKVGLEQDFESIPSEVQNNYELYLKSLQSPMPFFLGAPTVADGVLNFVWEESYDFRAQDIAYRFIIARDPSFNEIEVEESLVNLTNIQIQLLDPGEYYWTVIAANEAGNTQLPFDSLFDAGDTPRSGLKRFYVTPEGELQE
jgi:spore coat protein H